MKRRWAVTALLGATVMVVSTGPASGHIKRHGDAADQPGRFDIKQVAMDHGTSESCERRCVEIGIKTYENWSPKLLDSNSAYRNFYILFGSKRHTYDRYLWIWWAGDHLVASMKDYNGSHFTTWKGRFLGAAAVAKEGTSLAVRFPKRLLRKTRGNPFDHTKQVWWNVASEFKGRGCREVCIDFGPRRGVLHRF
jgi:hypothetical protein